jgi:hypothetical protein
MQRSTSAVSDPNNRVAAPDVDDAGTFGVWTRIACREPACHANRPGPDVSSGR